jgi:hypothetical protein
MALKLKKPAAPKTDAPATNADTARFISNAKNAPTSGKTPVTNFRLEPAFTEILSAEATRTGQNKTTIMKAMIVAWEEMDEAHKDRCILKSARM